MARKDSEEIDDDPVLTPGGLRRRDQVHEVAPGETVRFDKDGKPVRAEDQDEEETARDDDEDEGD
jgi:hypothetical protein